MHQPIAPLPPTPVHEPQASTYLPTQREQNEGQYYASRQGRPKAGKRARPPRQRKDALPDGTFLASLDSLEPLFERYAHRLIGIRDLLDAEQRQLLGALYATAEHRGYDLGRIDAIAKRFANEHKGYTDKTVPNPMAAFGVVIDTQA